MTTESNAGKCVWCLSVVFISYLLIGSFIVSRDILELVYLIILYSCLIIQKVLNKKNSLKENL